MSRCDTTVGLPSETCRIPDRVIVLNNHRVPDPPPLSGQGLVEVSLTTEEHNCATGTVADTDGVVAINFLTYGVGRKALDVMMTAP